LTLFGVLTSCDNSRQNKQTPQSDSNTINQNSLTNDTSNNFEIIEINCDSIYNNKGTVIRLVPIDRKANNESEYKFILLVTKQQNGKHSEFYRDTIESTAQKVEFADFNNDNVKDILVQNISDARSNWTYFLYIVDEKKNSLRKIKGFEKIKNPNYLSQYDLIDNIVMSGRNWTNFYKIVGDTIKDFNIIIDYGEDENGKNIYEANYKEAIQKILTSEKNSL